MGLVPDYMISGSEGQEIDLLGDGKLMKKCLKVGTGSQTPPPGAKLYVHYAGRLENGEQFDSSRERGEEINFPVGQGQVIKGWEFGFPTMRKGERCELSIHHSLAYGEAGKPPTIPPCATLIFDVELLRWEVLSDVTPEGGLAKSVMKQALVKSEEYTKPSFDTVLTVDLHEVKAHDDGVGEEALDADADVLRKKTVKKDLRVEIGAEQVPHELEVVLKQMVKGETSRFLVRCGLPGVAPDAPTWDTLGLAADVSAVQVVVTLKDMVCAKQVWECKTPAEKIAEADRVKVDGNALYKAKKFKRAAAKYEAGLAYLDKDESDECKKAKVPLLTNLSAVQIEMKQNFFAAKNCEKALEIDTKNIRAWVRKAKAERLRASFEDSIKDAECALLLDPDNKDAKLEIELCKKQILEQKKKDKATFVGMFDKLAKKGPVERKEAPAAPQELDFKDSVPRTLYINDCCPFEAVGEYRLNAFKLHRNSPLWERVSDNPQEAAWRIFSDPHGRWKFGISNEIESGLGYVKSEEPHNTEIMPHEVPQWLFVAEGTSPPSLSPFHPCPGGTHTTPRRTTDGDWTKDTTTNVSTEKLAKKVGPEQA